MLIVLGKPFPELFQPKTRFNFPTPCLCTGLLQKENMPNPTPRWLARARAEVARDRERSKLKRLARWRKRIARRNQLAWLRRKRQGGTP